jgi:hypothetical protein
LLPRMLSVSSGDVLSQCRQVVDKSPDLGSLSLARVTYMALAKCLLSKRSRDCQCQGGCECMEAWCGKRQRPLSRDKGIRHWTAWRSGLGACARARCIHAFTCSRSVVVWLETMPCEVQVRRLDQTRSASSSTGTTELEED